MVKIEGLFMIGTERKSPEHKHFVIFDNISFDLGDKMQIKNNVMYSKNGHHKLWLRIKLWIVVFLFKRDFRLLKAD